MGIIGGGFVGGSFADGFKDYTEVKLFDINPARSTHSHDEVINQDVLVVALNTPMVVETGAVDTSILDGALRKLNQDLSGLSKPVILKSTVPPEALGGWNKTCSNLELVFNPEFLRELTALSDFQQSNRIILGTHAGCSPSEKEYNLKRVELLFTIRFPEVPIYWTSYAEASLVKYFTNTFFCTKLSLLNEFAQICEKYGLDFNTVFEKVMLDQRIGRSHFQVPGHDGKKGFGGHCFPKDINGYLNIARQAGVLPTVSEAAWEKNLEVRSERDWESEIGRAVSKKKEKKS